MRDSSAVNTPDQLSTGIDNQDTYWLARRVAEVARVVCAASGDRAVAAAAVAACPFVQRPQARAPPLQAQLARGY